MDYLEKTAEISDCGLYRYVLGRRMEEGGRVRVYVGLNPSTADALGDDPTVRRWAGFAKRDGFSALMVVNLFAYRATDPKELERVRDPVGPENGRWLVEAMSMDEVVVCWGAHPIAKARSRWVRETFGGLRCFGVTKDGEPKHALYLPRNAELVPW